MKYKANILVYVVFVSAILLAIFTYISIHARQNIITLNETQISNQAYKRAQGDVSDLIVGNKTGQLTIDEDNRFVTRYLDEINLFLNLNERQEYRFTEMDNEDAYTIDSSGTGALAKIQLIWNKVEENSEIEMTLAKWEKNPLNDSSRLKTLWNYLEVTDARNILSSCNDDISPNYDLTSDLYPSYKNCFNVTDENGINLDTQSYNYIFFVRSATEPVNIVITGLSYDDTTELYHRIKIPDKYLHVFSKQKVSRGDNSIIRKAESDEVVYENGTYPGFAYNEHGILF